MTDTSPERVAIFASQARLAGGDYNEALSDLLEAQQERIQTLQIDLKVAKADCERYRVASVGLQNRAEAAEARVKRLRRVLNDCAEVLQFAYMNAPEQPKEIADALAVLKQTETGGPETSGRPGP